MTPSEKAMPVVTATWHELRRSYLVELPGNVTLAARDEAAVEELVRRYASGSATRYRRGTAGSDTSRA